MSNDAEYVAMKQPPFKVAGIEEKLGFASAVNALAMTMLGTGIIAFPFAFSLCGLVVAPIALIVIGVLALMSYVSLVNCTTAKPCAAYEELLQHIPSFWGYYLSGSLWLLLDLALGAYACISRNVIKSVLPKDFIPDELLVLIYLICIYPFCLLRTMHGLTFINGICAVAIITVVCLIVVLSSEAAAWSPPVHEAELVTAPMRTLLSSSLFSAAMFGHMNVQRIYAELKPSVKTYIHHVSGAACGLTFILYIGVGVSGYIAFGPDVKEDIDVQLAIYSKGGVAISILQFLVTSFVVLKTPLLIMPMRTITLNAISSGTSIDSISALHNALLTLFLFVCQYLTVIAVPKFGLILELVGLVVTIPVMLIIPARLSWAIEQPRPVWRCVIMFTLGIILFILNSVSLVLNQLSKHKI